MKQVLFIHGGTLAKDNDELFNTMQTREVNPFEEKKRWRLTLENFLPGYTVIKPEMPNKEMASYKIRKLWFEKYFQYLDGEDFILIGHSLGAMFLLKYLGENGFPIKIRQLHIVAPVLDDEGLNEGDNYLGDFAYQPEVLKNISKRAEKVYIWHSKDDPVVPFHHSKRIVEYIDGVKFMIFEDRGHFNQAEFPELIEAIKNN